eukprot:361308-Chlamydomonas_euryale.AAC.5
MTTRNKLGSCCCCSLSGGRCGGSALPLGTCIQPWRAIARTTALAAAAPSAAPATPTAGAPLWRARWCAAGIRKYAGVRVVVSAAPAAAPAAAATTAATTPAADTAAPARQQAKRALQSVNDAAAGREERGSMADEERSIQLASGWVEHCGDHGTTGRARLKDMSENDSYCQTVPTASQTSASMARGLVVRPKERFLPQHSLKKTATYMAWYWQLGDATHVPYCHAHS